MLWDRGPGRTQRGGLWAWRRGGGEHVTLLGWEETFESVGVEVSFWFVPHCQRNALVIFIKNSRGSAYNLSCLLLFVTWNLWDIVLLLVHPKAKISISIAHTWSKGFEQKTNLKYYTGSAADMNDKLDLWAKYAWFERGVLFFIFFIFFCKWSYFCLAVNKMGGKKSHRHT